MRSLLARFFAALLLALSAALPGWAQGEAPTYGKEQLDQLLAPIALGVVYQKNLGPNSAAIAAKLQHFDPDPSWQAVQPPSTLAGK